MKKLMIGIAAAAVLLTAAPAMAQFGIRADDGGVSVRVGRDHDRDRDARRAYGMDRHRHHDGCKTITVRERLPNGNVIVRTRERC